MKTNIIWIIIVVAIVFFFVVFVSFQKKHNKAQTNIPPEKNPSLKLRETLFTKSRDELGISEGYGSNGVYGVLMETGYKEGTASLIALSDGTTSFYFSRGGGIISGGVHENIRNATMPFVKLADEFVGKCLPADSFPLPINDQTIFYILTDNGVKTAAALEHDLGQNRHEFSRLFHAGQDVITELRKTTDQFN